MTGQAVAVMSNMPGTTPEVDEPYARARKKEMSLDGWRQGGSGSSAAQAAGVCRATVHKWCRRDPAYRKQVDDALQEYAETVGRNAHLAIAEHIAAGRRGDVVLARRGTEAGKPVEVYERAQLNPALLKLALTRADPRFTHPKQEVDVTVRTVGEALDAIETVTPLPLPSDDAAHALPSGETASPSLPTSSEDVLPSADTDGPTE